jgi:hypothetical protein
MKEKVYKKYCKNKTDLNLRLTNWVISWIKYAQIKVWMENEKIN